MGQNRCDKHVYRESKHGDKVCESRHNGQVCRGKVVFRCPLTIAVLRYGRRQTVDMCVDENLIRYGEKQVYWIGTVSNSRKSPMVSSV